VMANLGHKAVVNYQMKSDPVPDDIYDITNVVHPGNIAYGAVTGIVKVYGVSGSEYKIYVQKKASTTSGTTATTGGYYNFATSSFQDLTAHKAGTIGSGGLTLHTVILPTVAADTRYDVTIEAVNSATLSTQVPTAAGDATMIHFGVRQLTIKPVVATAGDWGTLPTLVFSRPASYTGSATQSTRGETVSTVGGINTKETPSSAKLVITGSYKRIKHGMILMSAFNGAEVIIPPGITVTGIRRDNITLSGACTIPTGTKLQFVDASGLIPFSLTVPASRNVVLKTGIDYRASVSIGSGNGGVRLKHVVATLLTSQSVKIDGYVQISSIDVDGDMDISVDNYVETAATP
jgi:hypothetical protein